MKYLFFLESVIKDEIVIENMKSIYMILKIDYILLNK